MGVTDTGLASIVSPCLKSACAASNYPTRPSFNRRARMGGSSGRRGSARRITDRDITTRVVAEAADPNRMPAWRRLLSESHEC